MTERRSMAQALQTAELSPEKLAFIRAGTPKPLEEPPLPQKTAAPSATPKEVPISQDKTNDVTSVRTRRDKPITEPEPFNGDVLVSMTVRVPREIPDGLVRASADRRLKRLRPCTQQEIVREALAQWFRNNGY